MATMMPASRIPQRARRIVVKRPSTIRFGTHRPDTGSVLSTNGQIVLQGTAFPLGSVGYAQSEYFHPTFLYESLWDLCVVGIVLLVERRFTLRRGSLLAVYAAAYTFGRFFTEYERVDFAHKIGPFRLNDWTSVVVFVASLTVLVVMNRGGRRTPDTVDGDPPAAIPPADLDRDPTDATDSAHNAGVADTAHIGDISDGEPADAG